MSEATTEREAGGNLWITRMKQDGTDYEVAEIAYAEEGAAETLSHARRVFRGVPQHSDDLRRGDLLVNRSLSAVEVASVGAPVLPAPGNTVRNGVVGGAPKASRKPQPCSGARGGSRMRHTLPTTGRRETR